MFEVQLLENRTRGKPRVDYKALGNGDRKYHEPSQQSKQPKVRANKPGQSLSAKQQTVAQKSQTNSPTRDLVTAKPTSGSIYPIPVVSSLLAQQNTALLSKMSGADEGSEKGAKSSPLKEEGDAADSVAARIASLEERNKRLLKQKEALQKEAEVRHWERLNADLELEILKMDVDERKKELPAKPPHRTVTDHRRGHRGGESGTEFEGGSGPEIENIQQLRRLEYLQRKAEEELHQWGLESDQDTGADGHGSSRGMQSGKKSRKSKKSHIPFPHESLGYEYVANKKSFDDLDIRLFVAGELGVMSRPNIPRAELEGRRDLLKILMYHAGNYQWKAVKNLYSVIIDSIYVQKDRKWENWDHDLARLETMMLMSYALPKGESSKGGNLKKEKSKSQSSYNNYKYDDEVDNQIWYCTAYNKGNCKHNQPHNHYVAGKTRVVQHICATCHKKKEYSGHREKSADCPYNN